MTTALSEPNPGIAEEPIYQSSRPKCLLVFGPNPNMRVSVVLDVDVLYVDRNGSRDLTEDGKRLRSGQATE